MTTAQRSPQKPLAGIDLLRSEYDNALSCIRCGLCLSVCPTYQLTMAEEEGPRGRIAIARAVIEGALPITDDFVEHEEACLLCEACTAICPAGVRMEPLGVAVRSAINERRRKPLRERIGLRLGMDGLLGDMGRFRLACRLARLYQRAGLQRLLRRSGLLRLLRLDSAEALLPPMPGRFVSPEGQRWLPPDGATPRRRVALFTGCIMSTAFAATTEATARLLARRGCEVIAAPDQGCCGALHLHSGEMTGARRLAATNLAAFNPDEFDAIIVNSAGCGSTLKGYGHLMNGASEERAAAFAMKVRDITEYLDTLAERPPMAETPLTVTYQEPCHLAHAQRISAAPRRLLSAIPGLTLREMAESALCCGSAGVYNVTHPAMANALLARKLTNAAATGASVIATANPGCLLQLQAGVARRGEKTRVCHIVDLLDEAERRAER